MFDLDKIREIWQTISRNKTRSLLTAFGVFWGMFMFIFMIGIGQGFENGLRKEIGEISPNSMFVFGRPTSIEYKGFNAGRYWQMTNDDLLMLKDQIPEIEYISGMTFAGYGSKTTRKDKSGDFYYRGNSDTYYKIEPHSIVQGRLINRLDVLEKRKVCVLGIKVFDQLFSPEKDAVGQEVMINGISFTVIGVVTVSGNISFGGDSESTIYIPISTLQQLGGRGMDIDIIAIATSPRVNIKTLEKKVSELIKSKHFIAPNDENAVSTFNIQDFFMMFNYLFIGINILIWIVGIGTLFAGVVGISNIMLVSVKERTNEIGIKRALGAKPKVITRQIVWETLTLTFIAGFLGMFFGVLVLVILDYFVKSVAFINPTISFNMSIAATIIIIFAGLIAGIIPAKNAIRIKAIDALRDE